MIHTNQKKWFQREIGPKVRVWVMSVLVIFPLVVTSLYAADGDLSGDTDLDNICSRIGPNTSDNDLKALEQFVAAHDQWAKTMQKNRDKTVKQAEQARDHEEKFKTQRDEIDSELRKLRVLYEQEKKDIENYYYQQITDNRNAIDAAQYEIGGSMSDIRVAENDIQVYKAVGHGMQVKSEEARIKRQNRK